MKLRYILLSAPLVAMSLPALAQDMTIDTDGDENYSYTELLAVMPDMPMVCWMPMRLPRRLMRGFCPRRTAKR